MKKQIYIENNGKGNRGSYVNSDFSTFNLSEAKAKVHELSFAHPTKVVSDHTNKEGRKRVTKYYIHSLIEFEGVTMQDVKKMNDNRDIAVHKMKNYTVCGVELR